MNSVKVQKILIAIVILLIGGAGASYYFASKFLNDHVTTTDHLKIDAKIGDQRIAQLNTLEGELARQAPNIERTQQIVAQSTQYRYQDQVVSDVHAFAAEAGVKIVGFNFEESATAQGTSGASSITGARAVNTTVTLETPVKYENFLRFLMAIERNLTKMQISSINMTPAPSSPGQITSTGIVLQVYING